MDNKEALARIEIIKELAGDPAVKQLCRVLLKWISKHQKSELGFGGQSAAQENSDPPAPVDPG